MPLDWTGLGDFSRVSTSSAIAAVLLALIGSGELGPGTVLPPERELATSLGVSRTTIREAIHELTLKGVLTRRQGSGTVVVDRSASGQELLRDMSATERDAEEVIDFRTVFEPEIASLAAVRRTESDLVVLSRLCDYRPDKVGASESLDLDQRFHEAVAAATHNRLIVTLGRVTSEWLVDFRRASHASVEGRRMSLDGHREIAEPIGAGDDAKAAVAMRAHVTAVGRM